MTMSGDLDWLESLIEARYGFTPSRAQREHLEKWLGKGRARRSVVRTEHAASLHDLVDCLVVGETYFFREAAQIEHCMSRAVPALARAKGYSGGLRILSAGCSSGEEAYSLAIAASGRANACGDEVSILGIDVSASAIKNAERGRYSAWSLRATPAHIRDTYFRQYGNEYEIDARFRALVQFEQRNLFDPDPDFWALGTFDIIYCRNVTIYFSPRAVKELMRRFASILHPGGFLYLGHSESLRGISDDFESIYEDGIFGYRRKERTGLATRDLESLVFHVPALGLPEVRSIAKPLDRPGLSATPLSTVAKHMAPQPASQRVHATREWYREKILSLLERERFDEALAVLGTAPACAENDLYRAVVNSAKGRIHDVVSTCQMLLASRQFESEAHHLLALCHSHERAFDLTALHYRHAIHLDPTFAMPRLQLGLLLDRTGDPKRASIELEAALGLLAQEQRGRMALFGGGFSREALVVLCRTKLRQTRSNDSDSAL